MENSREKGVIKYSLELMRRVVFGWINVLCDIDSKMMDSENFRKIQEKTYINNSMLITNSDNNKSLEI